MVIPSTVTLTGYARLISMISCSRLTRMDVMSAQGDASILQYGDGRMAQGHDDPAGIAVHDRDRPHMNRDVCHHHRAGGGQSRHSQQTAAQNAEGLTAGAAQDVFVCLHGCNQPFPVFFRLLQRSKSTTDSSGFWCRLVLYAHQIALSNRVFVVIFVNYAQTYADSTKNNRSFGGHFARVWPRPYPG